jgi:hypothetical protein
MKLPRRHLLRLRRKIRRSMTSAALRPGTGARTMPRPPPHPVPPDRMKHAFFALLLLILAVTALALSSCATIETKTTVTAPDGTVTVTESKTTAPDAGSMNALAGTAAAFAPGPVIIASGK